MPWKLGLAIGVALMVAGLAAYAKYQTERVGELKAATTHLTAAVDTQRAATAAALQERDALDRALQTAQQQYAALEKQKQRVRTEIRTVIRDDPEAAECGNAALPDSVTRIVREYARGDDAGTAGDAPDGADGDVTGA